MKYSDEYEAYVLEFNDMVFCWDDEPDEDQVENVNVLREAYHHNIRDIAEEIYAEIKDMFDVKDVDEVISKLGRPQIFPENGMITYCEHTFDDTHVIDVEYSDDEFEQIEYVSVDG